MNQTSAENMYSLLCRLWAAAPKMTDAKGAPDPSQAPAVICHVLLKGNMTPLYGALSQTPEGVLRMMTKATVQGEDGRPRAAIFESFFDVGEISSLMVERELAQAPASGLIISS